MFILGGTVFRWLTPGNQTDPLRLLLQPMIRAIQLWRRLVTLLSLGKGAKSTGDTLEAWTMTIRSGGADQPRIDKDGLLGQTQSKTIRQ